MIDKKINNMHINKNIFLKKKLAILLLIFLIIFSFLSNVIYANNNNSGFAKNNYSHAVFLANDNTFILHENLNTKIHPASLTKVAIAIHAIEKLDLDKVIKIKEPWENIESGYVSINLKVGEKISVKDLLYATLLQSANDAAMYLMQEIYKSPKSFEKGINKYLKSISCNNTHFVSTYGKSSSDHYTTAHDLCIIANHAVKNRKFKEIISKSTYTIPATNMSNSRRVNSTYLNLKKYSTKTKVFNGIKTGYTEEALNCFIAQANIDGNSCIIVTTGNKHREDIFTNVSKDYDEINLYLSIKKEANKNISSLYTENNNLFTSFFKKASIYFYNNFNIDMPFIKVFIFMSAIFITILFLISIKLLFRNKDNKSKRTKRKINSKVKKDDKVDNRKHLSMYQDK